MAIGIRYVASGQTEKVLDLKIMTYNIRYAADHPEVHAWKNRRDGIISAVSGMDLAGLQEVLPVQVDYLGEKLPEHNIISRSREKDPADGEAVPLIYRKDKFRLEDSGVFWLSDYPHVPGSNTWNAACNRIATWGRFIDVKTGIEFYFFNTHLDHISQTAREKSAELIINTIRMIAAGSPVILTGDFNSEEDNNVYRLIKDSGFKDTYREIHPAFDSTDLTFHGWENEAGLSRIDYIFVTPEIEIKNSAVIRKKHNSGFPSDHFPVVAEITLIKQE
jgi:endonuclease/exonuclease/phosphatase family metal-dependent hydrolase